MGFKAEATSKTKKGTSEQSDSTNSMHSMNSRRIDMRTGLKYAALAAAALLIVVGGSMLFNDKMYAWISLAMAVLTCVPFFMTFENKHWEPTRVIIVAVMVALTVLGRFAFAFIPHFKPVTAIVVICGIYLGGETGFLCGSLSAVISNFFFGQGPWTPFQMLAWGLIGLLAALFARPLKNSRVALVAFGLFAGAAYSVLMDVWTTLWMDGGFNFARFWANILMAVQVTVVYMVSNVVFLLLLTKPIGQKLDRIRVKYGV